MPGTQSLFDPKNYHILTYGTLLGSNLFQTFLAGPLAFKALPRPSFSTLQQAIFPPYFTFQTALPLVLALTWPGEKLAQAGGAVARRHAGPYGLLEEENRWIALLPIVIMFGTSLLNLVALGPATTKVMKERKHQETRDGKRYYEPGPKSEAMQKLNKSFAWLHGASSLSNVVGLGAMLVYGFTLAEKI
ncbi:Xanthocillin biosynthesis cluster protein D [Pseudocercospora fuligena]|uniref:Xanthocillin biosynthesis cluster protein D n=1 Tax=Pseudocercospora fuligena TaxID=685502 RepID=A0A8H6RSP1_9PEZI|nr:Xanthocillin biosynthesis cluster protein D [Pseudocercospora fuligena]